MIGNQNVDMSLTKTSKTATHSSYSLTSKPYHTDPYVYDTKGYTGHTLYYQIEFGQR